jgi:hypothetical protein
MTEPNQRGRGKYSKVIRELEDQRAALIRQMERIVGIKDDEIADLREKVKILESIAGTQVHRLPSGPSFPNGEQQ